MQPLPRDVLAGRGHVLAVQHTRPCNPASTQGKCVLAVFSRELSPGNYGRVRARVLQGTVSVDASAAAGGHGGGGGRGVVLWWGRGWGGGGVGGWHEFLSVGLSVCICVIECWSGVTIESLC